MPASTPQNIPNAKSRRTPISGSEPGSSDENQNHPCAPSARPSYADLLYISEHVTKWRKLMGYLLSDTQCNVQKEIEELEEKQHHKSLQTSDCTRQALEIWRQRKGSRATILDLFDVLVRIGRTDVKEGLEGRMGRQRSFPIGLNVGSTPHSSPLIGGAWRKISNDLEVPENEKILSLVNHPDVNFVSVAGTIGSGKTFVLENLARDFANKVSVAKRRIIKVSMEHPISVIEIAKDITANLEFKDMPISSRHDAKRQVKQALIPCLQSYDLVLLLLDLSLIPQCPHSGKPVLEFLYDLLQCENLSNLNIVVSSLCSMKGCKIFRDLKNAAVEIVMTELSYKRAVEFILSENDKFPEKCAVYLCNKYERSPQILKCIAQIDLNEWYDLPEDNEAELMKALESNEDECRECVSNNVEGKRHLENIFSCLTPDQKKTVTQCLVFRDDFDIDRAILVVDHEISISVGKLHSLESILLLRSKRSSENEKTLFAFPKIVGELLRNVVKEDRSYFSDYVKAEERFCRIYLDLLELLGQNFLGFIGEKRQEVKILAPLTPTASVPNAFLLSSQDADNRVRLLIKLFRDHETEIMQSLKLCVNHSQLHDRILNTACKLPVLSLMNKLLPLHVTITIYRKLKRMTEIRDDRLGMARINVCIAYYWMHSYGFQWFHGEATNLLEAAHEELFEHGADEKLLDDRANCISKLGRSFAAEGMQDEMNTGRILTGIELIKSGISKWENKIYQSVIDEVLIATNRRHIAGAYHQIGMLDKAEQILTQKVQPVFQKYLGNSHPLTVNSFNTLGVIKRKKKHLQAAKEMLFKALELSKELLGDHGDTARLLHELGLCCVDEADQLVREDPEKKRLLKEAKMYFEDAAKVARKVVGDREITAGSFRKLLDVCKQLGESDEELHYIEAELQRIEPKLNKYLHEVRNTASVN